MNKNTKLPVEPKGSPIVCTIPLLTTLTYLIITFYFNLGEQVVVWSVLPTQWRNDKRYTFVICPRFK